MNEGQTPKISYDYQAALGEFGQVRESYRRLKTIHYFVRQFGEKLCDLQTVLPAGASLIAPKDDKTLRYAVRTDGKRGFLFINNYQDHFSLPDRRGEEITLQLEQGKLTWNLGIVGDENAILPFHFDMDGIDLVQASAQAVTKTVYGGEVTYVFFVPDGMQGEFRFEDKAKVAETGTNAYKCAESIHAECFTVEKGTVRCKVLVLSRSLANDMFLLSDGRLIFTDEALLEDEEGIRLESTKSSALLHVYPMDGLERMTKVKKVESDCVEIFGSYQIETEEKKADIVVKQAGASRYTIQIQRDVLKGVKDMRLQIEYTGDIGKAFIDGRMIHDNFANGAVWEIGLKDFERELEETCITVYIVPLKEGANINVQSVMAARSEEVKSYIAALKSARLQPVYEMEVC